MSASLINPYNLLGVKTESNISELKKNYYQLSLLTHPDKGGSPEDFQTVHLAYQYIKEQLEGVKDVSYEELEEEFANFCEAQEKEKPSFYEVSLEANDWLNEFNAKFENKLETEVAEQYNPFSEGYGTLMDPSEINLDSLPVDLNGEMEFPTEKDFQEHQGFEGEIVEYKEPDVLPNFVKFLPLDKKEIKDFSVLDGNLQGSDYKIAHSKVLPDSTSNNLEEKIKQIGAHKKFKDFPAASESLEYSANL